MRNIKILNDMLAKLLGREPNKEEFFDFMDKIMAMKENGEIRNWNRWLKEQM